VLDLIGFTLGQLVPIFFIIGIGPSLAIILPAAFLARALSVGLNLGWVIRLERVNTLLVFDRLRFKELFAFGVWVTVTNVIGPLLASIDQLFVGSALGATAVAHYTVPMNLVSRSQVLSLSLSTVLFPRFSQLSREQSMALAKKGVLSLGYGFGAICALAIILGGPFLRVWLGIDFAFHAAPVLKFLLIGAWFNGIAYIPYSFLQGQGRPDLVAKLHTLEFVPYIALLWLLLHRFGLPGAALACSSRVAVDSAVLFVISRFPINPLLRLAPVLVLIVASYLVTQLTDVSLVASTLFAGLVFIAFVLAAYVFDATAGQIILSIRARLLPG
jgi:O-antigen/teichoic acid export membrane protein